MSAARKRFREFRSVACEELVVLAGAEAVFAGHEDVHFRRDVGALDAALCQMVEEPSSIGREDEQARSTASRPND